MTAVEHPRKKSLLWVGVFLGNSATVRSVQGTSSHRLENDGSHRPGTNDMKTRLPSLLLPASLLLPLLAPATHAQEGSPPPARRVTEPLRQVQLDLQTGTITRGPAVQQRGFGGLATTSTLNNLDHSGFVGVDSGPGTPNGPCEWIDHGVKNGGASTYMTGFAFAYCSSALSPNSGGTGGSVRIGFRSGYLPGPTPNQFLVSGTEAGAFNLTGLPANTSCSSFFGGFNCYLITIDIGPVPVVLPDGDIGWSWRFSDVGTDGVLAKTFPFLSCVQSCTGSGPSGTGITDTMDQYCPAGTFRSSFSFGTSTGGSYYTSLSIDIREALPVTPSVVAFNGSGTNPLLLTGNAPTLGGPFNLTLNCIGADPAKLAIYRISFAPNPTPTATRWGEVLVSLQAATGLALFQAHGGGLSHVGLTLPSDPALYGRCWSVQGFCGDSPAGFLSNGLIQTMG